MFAPVVHYLRQTNIRRSRMLFRPGRVMVTSGQRVAPNDVIAEVPNPASHFFLDIRKSLGLDTFTAEELIQRKPGERLMKGDILAETGGAFSRVVRAPCDCQISEINSGVMMMITEGEPVQILAGLTGFAREYTPEFGAIVESGGALVQGVWGNGKTNTGMVSILCDSPDQELTTRQLEASVKGCVAIAGFCAAAEPLRLAAEMDLHGLILSAINPDLLGQVDNLDFPIMLIEGFGKQPMNPAAFAIFHEFEKREAAVHACSWNKMTGERPEVLIPFQNQALEPAEVDEFAPGQQVHIKLPPINGEVGTILERNQGLTELSNGLRTPTALLRMQNGERMIVPLANLELII